MTKDLALLVGADQKWLSTTGFLDKVDAEPEKGDGRIERIKQVVPDAHVAPVYLEASREERHAMAVGKPGREDGHHWHRLLAFSPLALDFALDRRGAYPLADTFFDHVLDPLGNAGSRCIRACRS